MQKLLVLTNRGWTDPVTHFRVFRNSQGWRQYGSPFLLLAILLHVLGGVISPLQAVFLSTRTIKVPGNSHTSLQVLDLPNQWTNGDSDGTGNQTARMTAFALWSATTGQFQRQLWEGRRCASSDGDNEDASSGSCSLGITFSNMLGLADPFLVELPYGFNTGLIRQFIPRINSTAHVDCLPRSGFPSDCQNRPGAFFVDYYDKSQAPDEMGYWALQVCMPSDLRQSPWKKTRNRQDFSEELYINVTLKTIPYPRPEEACLTKSLSTLQRDILNCQTI